MGGSIILRGIGRGVGLGIAALVLNALIAAMWVWFYSIALAPGHDGGFYQAYGQRVAPICGLLAGIPLLFVAGVLSSGEPRPLLSALIPVAAYAVLDIGLTAAAALWSGAFPLILSYLTKAGAALVGGWLRSRRRQPADQ